jgi:glycosyltransferase involved in cell wall biosynthesis
VRILIFNWKDLAHPASGGAEVFTESVARELVRRGHAVTLFAAAVAGKPQREIVEGVEIVRRGGRLGVYREARRFWRKQPPRAYDVVVDEINTRPFLAPRWVRGTPVVALIHQLAREVWFYETPWPVAFLGRYILEPWWLRSYRKVPALTVSESSADSLRRHHRWREVTVVPEGHVPHEDLAVTKEKDPTIIFLGRLVPMKRPEDAVEALRLVRKDVPNARLWIVGDGPMLTRLRAQATPGVELLGRLGPDEVRGRLARAHVLVATGVREGWGLNVSEAAACGTPSIGYAVPGLVDSVRASGGAVVEANPQALAKALLDLFEARAVLEPRMSTRPWRDVTDVVEHALAAACSHNAGRPSGSDDEPA